MAKGRRDYTWGVLQDSILPGRYSANFFQAATKAIFALTADDVFTYTVPEGYRLFLTGVCVSVSNPPINGIYIIKDSTILITLYFALNYIYDFGSFGSITFEEGEILKVRGINYDDIIANFTVVAFGVLEQLV